MRVTATLSAAAALAAVGAGALPAQAGVETTVGIAGANSNGPGYAPTPVDAFQGYNYGDGLGVPRVSGGPPPPVNYSGKGATGEYHCTYAVYGGCSAAFPSVKSSGSTDTTGALGSASESLQGATNTGGTAYATAAANEKVGQLHATAGGDFEYSFQGQDQGNSGYALAGLYDTLTFNVAGATSTTVTDITLNFALDGVQTANHFSNYGGQAGYMGWNVAFGGTQINQASQWAPTVGGAPGTIGGAVPIYDDSIQQAAGGGDLSLLSVKTISDTPEETQLQFVYQLTGASVTAGFADSLALNCGTGVYCNYQNTSTIGFALPRGVTFTSASGQFLTGGGGMGGVPEPATWALMMVGIGLVGAGLRRDRNRSQMPSQGVARAAL